MGRLGVLDHFVQAKSRHLCMNETDDVRRFMHLKADFQILQPRLNSSLLSTNRHIETYVRTRTHVKASSPSSSLNLHIKSFIQHNRHYHDHHLPTFHSGHTQGVSMCSHRRTNGVEFGIHSACVLLPFSFHPGS